MTWPPRTRVRLADAHVYPYADQDETGTLLGYDPATGNAHVVWDSHPEYGAAACHPSRLTRA